MVQTVVGGSVSNAATDRIVDWAAFLCEYSHLLRPLTAGPSETLTGNNIVYRRALLDRYRAETEAGRFEDHLHRALPPGWRHARVPSGDRSGPQEALHRRRLSYSAVPVRPLVRGRPFAAERRGRLVLAMPWLPAPFRRCCSSGLCRVSAARRGIESALAKSLPLIALFVIGWAAGEMVGALGGPGDALSRVS